MFVDESILDTPQSDLDIGVWFKDEDGIYHLTDNATQKITEIIQHMMTDEKTKLNSYGVHITGSITSNCYTNDSDIDIHFYSKEINSENADEFNKIFRKTFESLKSTRPSDCMIDSHPIEVYFQKNEFQDYMSIGCYDFIQKKWIVGPELKPMDYDPFSDLYNDDMKHITSIIDDIRNVILQCFETSIAIKNSNDEKFKNFEFGNLKDRMAKAASIFKNAQEYRKLYSSPTSFEQAQIYRNSRKWKIADSSFKLLDKFGYLRILRTLTQCWEKLQQYDQISKDVIVETIIDVIRDNIGNNVNLTEEEISKFDEYMVDESILGTSKYLLIATVLSMGIINKDALADDLSKIPNQNFTVSNNVVQNVIKSNFNINEKVGPMSYTNAVNAIARTIFREAGGEGDVGMDAIASVILNRSGNDKNRMIDVISKYLQFSCWNAYNKAGGGWDDKTFTYKIPSVAVKNGKTTPQWNYCVNLAKLLIAGKFKSTIGNRNSYMNKKTADKKNVDSWGKKLDIKIGKHDFGYLREHDGFRNNKVSTPQQRVHTVKSGETLSSIANKYKTTVDKLLAKNTDIKDKDKISIGTKLKF